MTDALVTRAADLRLDTFDAERRTVEVVFATEAPVRRRDYRGPFDEILAITKDSIIADRLNGGSMSLLDSHDGWSMKGRLGVVLAGSFRVEGGRAMATVQLSQARAAELLADLTDGMPFPVSVGYRIHSFTESDDEIPVRTAVKWEPYELSAVPVPADAGAASRAANPKEEHMPTNRQVAPGEARRALEEERQIRHENRANVDADIIALGKRFGFEAGSDLVRGALKDGKSYADFREQLMDKLDTEDEEVRTNHAGAGPLHGSGQGDQVRSMSEALVVRVKPDHKPSDQARQYIGLSIPEIARRCLELNGRSTVGMSAAELVTRGLHSTGDFGQVLLGAMHMRLQAEYRPAGAALKRVSRKSTAVDFRDKHSIKLSEAGPLEKVNENGEFRRTTLSDSGEHYRIATFGKIFGITRQALVNDNLAAFDRIPRELAKAAEAHEAKALVTLLESNPAMTDGNTVFHASHANLGTGVALSVDALSGARIVMRKQTGLAGELISVTPKYLVVPTDLETEGEKVLTAIAAAKVSDVNPMSGKLELVVEPRLTDQGAWYLAADPGEIDGMEYSHLEGFEGPVLDIREGFDVDGVEFKVRLDFGAGWLDYRGWYKNPGA